MSENYEIYFECQTISPLRHASKWHNLFYVGQVSPPMSKNEIVVLPGSTARLNWTFVGEPADAILAWYFTGVNLTERRIAVKIGTGVSTTFKSTLPGFKIENPATLVFDKVNGSYNGKYRLNVQITGGTSGDSVIDFFVAGKFLKLKHINLSSVIQVVFNG